MNTNSMNPKAELICLDFHLGCRLSTGCLKEILRVKHRQRRSQAQTDILILSAAKLDSECSWAPPGHQSCLCVKPCNWRLGVQGILGLDGLVV